MSEQSMTDPAALQILVARAHALAQADVEANTAHGEALVLFQLGADTFGVPARAVREVQRLQRFTALPHTPPFVLGLVNLRGRLLVALDLRPLLELERQPPLADAMLLLLGVDGVEIGLLADSVDAVRASDAELAPSLSAASGRSVAWIRGIDRACSLIIDPEQLVADPRLTINTGGA